MTFHCWDTPEDVRFHIIETIAFQPSKGFMIVEGYFHFREKGVTFPVNALITQEIGRADMHTLIVDHYNITINNISKKYLPVRPQNLDYDEESGGYISYCEKYIIIVYFDIIKFNSEVKNNNTYSEINTDPRFKTTEEILKRYEELADYDENYWNVKITEKNNEFFKDYFKFEKL